MPLLHIRLTHNPAPPTTAKGQASALNPPKPVTAIPRITAQNLTFHHPTKTLEVGGKLRIRITDRVPDTRARHSTRTERPVHQTNFERRAPDRRHDAAQQGHVRS
jgi:hypothetical protein